MRKIKVNVAIATVMFLGVVCVLGGCGRESKEEATLISVEEADMEKETREDSKESNKETSDAIDAEGKVSDEDDTVIFVDVCGQVKIPGVYEFEPESRVYEAIKEAGGMTEDAAVSYLNQAEKLSDGQKVYVPSKDEVSSGQMTQEMPDASSQDGKVNLNTASKEELMTLSGIGEVKAESIIKFREEQGGFQSAEDIMKIEGIKEGVFNKIKDQIKI